jgi:hypothetical protein
MALDLALLGVLLAFAGTGALRGSSEAGVRLIGLPLSYGAAVLAGRLGGAPLAHALGSGGWMGAVVAGSLGFVAAQAICEIYARLARRRSREQGIPSSSRLLGSAFGALHGVLVVLPLVWLASFVEGARASGVRPDLPDLSGSHAASLVARAVALGTRPLAASEDRSARVTARMIGEPADSLGALHALVSDPRLRVLQSDQAFWGDLERGEVERALARPTYTELADDPQLRQQLAALGLIAEASGTDPERFRADMRALFTELAPRLRALREDPAFQEILADQSLRESVQAGNTLRVLLDPRVRALVGRVAN